MRFNDQAHLQFETIGHDAYSWTFGPPLVPNMEAILVYGGFLMMAVGVGLIIWDLGARRGGP